MSETNYSQDCTVNGNGNDEIIEVDPFDFEKYKLLYNCASQFYSGCELYFRAAVLIDYLINNTSSWNYQNLFKESHKEQHIFIQQVTLIFEHSNIVKKFYIHQNIHDKHVDEILHKYMHFHNHLFNRIYKKYINENHTHTQLWFK